MGNVEFKTFSTIVDLMGIEQLQAYRKKFHDLEKLQWVVERIDNRIKALEDV